MGRWRMAAIFALCASALIGVMAWLTVVVQRLEREQRQSTERAALEESVRLALWRLDSLLTPFVAQQNARPYRAYEAGESAPVAGVSSPHVRLYFEWDERGRLSSPELAAAVRRAAGASREGQRIEGERGLAQLGQIATRASLLERVGSSWLHVEREAPATAAPEELKRAPKKAPPVQVAKSDIAEQSSRNDIEFNARASNFSANFMQLVPKERAVTRSRREVRVGLLTPLWTQSELVLARRVRAGSAERLQGCWLDWPEMQGWLLAAIADILPEARLEPARDGALDQGRRLAALPIRLVPGPPAIGPPVAPSALKLPLIVAWVFAGVALFAAGALLWGSAALSERRAAFVSAVTHELRTPLTTFRMYADMLAEGMVPDEGQRLEYLKTLQREAERQSHLVENVLAYSRLERGRYTAQQTEMALGALLDEVAPALTTLAERYGMPLAVARPEGQDAVRVRVDRAGVERILVNLVDNAGKYARAAEDRRVVLECRVEGRCARLLVSDHGPGLTPRERRRLFRPFRKSARDAANSAPGVGLGLALSRRLARAMGGDLELVESGAQGTCLALRLPRVV